MGAAAAALPAGRQRAARAIAWGTLSAGVGDIAFAFAVSGPRGVRAVLVLQSANKTGRER